MAVLKLCKTRRKPLSFNNLGRGGPPAPARESTPKTKKPRPPIVREAGSRIATRLALGREQNRTFESALAHVPILAEPERVHAVLVVASL